MFCSCCFLDCLRVTWIHAYLSRADQNHDDKMSYDEVRTLLQMINIDLSDQYARSLFQVVERTRMLKGQPKIKKKYVIICSVINTFD